MEFYKYNCPHCKKELELVKGTKNLICPYCNDTISVKPKRKRRSKNPNTNNKNNIKKIESNRKKVNNDNRDIRELNKTFNYNGSINYDELKKEIEYNYFLDPEVSDELAERNFMFILEEATKLKKYNSVLHYCDLGLKRFPGNKNIEMYYKKAVSYYAENYGPYQEEYKMLLLKIDDILYKYELRKIYLKKIDELVSKRNLEKAMDVLRDLKRMFPDDLEVFASDLKVLALYKEKTDDPEYYKELRKKVLNNDISSNTSGCLSFIVGFIVVLFFWNVFLFLLAYAPFIAVILMIIIFISYFAAKYMD